MNISALPPLPQPAHGKGKLVADVAYTGPVLVQTKLGEMPHDYHSSSSYIDHSFVDCSGGACSTGGQEVWRGQPTYNSDGTAVVAPMTKHIDAHSKNPIAHGIMGGLIGGAIGAFVGVFGGIIAGNPLVGLEVGAAVGATVTAGGAALVASRDRIKLEWQEHSIDDLTMTGYHHTRHEQTRRVCTGFGKDEHCHEENDGWNHRFSAQIAERPVGTYWEPEVVHYQA